MPHICPVCKCHCECGGGSKEDIQRGEWSLCYCCQGFEGGGSDDSDELPEFEPCSRCDGHPACEESGCAYELGLGHLVQSDPGQDW